MSDTGNAMLRYAPWWGLVVVPTLFLGGLSLAYALVSLACRTGIHALVHVGPAGEVLAEVVGLALSGWCVVQLRTATPGSPAADRRFLSLVSLVTATLFLLASGVQWYVVIALSPCI